MKTRGMPLEMTEMLKWVLRLKNGVSEIGFGGRCRALFVWKLIVRILKEGVWNEPDKYLF